MTEATSRFFEVIDQRGHDPLLGRTVGTARFDLIEDGKTDHWLVSIDRGDITVSKEARQEVDAVFTSDAALFDRAVRGEINMISAMLRGAMVIQGDLLLISKIERLLPGPPDARGPRCLREGEQS